MYFSIMKEKVLIEKVAPGIYIDTNKFENIIRAKNRLDLEIIKHSVKEYIKRKDKDLVKLSLYAEKLGIKEVIMDYIGMMYE